MTFVAKDAEGNMICPECQLAILLSRLPDALNEECSYTPTDVKNFVIQNRSKLSLLVHTIWRREEDRIKQEAKARKEKTQQEKRALARQKKLDAAREGVMIEGFGCV